MRVEQRELHEEDSHGRDEFKASQVKCFREVHDHLITQVNNFNSFASYAMENLIRFIKTWLLAMLKLNMASMI